MVGKSYRRGVVGVFKRENLFLVGQRMDSGGWQFPQGGIDPPETPEQALYREMREEIGTDKFDVVLAPTVTLRYDFPADLQAPIAQKYRGQDQNWFLCELHHGEGPDLGQALDKEFKALDWWTADRVLATTILWKKEFYVAGLELLGIK